MSLTMDERPGVTPDELRIEIPEAPAIPGSRFRRYQGPADHPGLANVYNTQNRADGDPEVVTVASFDVDYANPTNCDPYQDVLVVEVDGTAVAYSRVSWEDQNDGSRRYLTHGWLDPAWRRRGIGGAMLAHSMRRLREIAAGHDTDRPRWFTSWCDDTNVGAAALLRRERFEPERRFYLMVRRDLDAIEVPPMPDGLEIRLVQPEHLRAIFLADNEAFLDHWGWVDTSDASYRRWTGAPHFDPSLFLVAWDGDQVAGAVLNLIDSDENEVNGYRRGWLDSVFTRRAWRRRGLAAALIGRSLVLLRERGMTSAQLGVDAENPNQALHLYESAGLGVDQSATAFRRPWDE